jgi:hypothetical protein
MPTVPSRLVHLAGRRLHRRPLAVCLAAILGAPLAFAAPAGTLVVTNCNDAGSGSLRDTVASAVSGDTITFSPSLGCSQITLDSGAIVIGQGSDGQPIASLVLIGPGRNALRIDGSYLDRVLVHDAGAAGSLTVSGLALSHGFTDDNGGGLLTQGSVSLTDVEIIECAAGQAAAAPLGNTAVRGGGLYVGGNATLDHSFIGDNKVDGHGGYAYGAGIFAGGDLTLTATTISGNYATSDMGATYGGGIAVGNRVASIQATLSMSASSIENNTAFSNCDACPVRGAGVWVYGNSTFEQSVISGNTAFSGAHYGTGGGLYFKSNFGGAPVTAVLTDTNVASNSADNSAGAIGAGGDLTITRGTISGNSANVSGGAIGLFSGDLHLVDSTLTGNIALERGGAIFLFGYGDIAVQNSTISENIANENGGGIANTYGSVHLANTTLTANTAGGSGGGIWFRYPYYALDLESTIVAGNSASGNPNDIFSPGQSVSGSHNLIVAALAIDLPTDTITDDPLLLALADNGGPTLTHALAGGSPAIDSGSNPHALEFDQRGMGFVRTYGSAADIGAFEVQPAEPADRIFADGFDAP